MEFVLVLFYLGVLQEMVCLNNLIILLLFIHDLYITVKTNPSTHLIVFSMFLQ